MAYSVVIAGPAERDLDEAVAARIRHCMARDYEVYYKVDEANHRVLVLAFLQGSRDAVRIMTQRL